MKEEEFLKRQLFSLDIFDYTEEEFQILKEKFFLYKEKFDKYTAFEKAVKNMIEKKPVCRC